jgi:hypothetical protein
MPKNYSQELCQLFFSIFRLTVAERYPVPYLCLCYPEHVEGLSIVAIHNSIWVPAADPVNWEFGILF